MSSIARKRKVDFRECHNPDCTAQAIDGGTWCRVCQALLDRVRKELEAGPSRNARVSGSAQLPTVHNVDEQRAASFDEGLKRRHGNGQPLTESGRIMRAVRIIQLRQAGNTNGEIIRKLYLAGQDELDEDLVRYRAAIESKASSRHFGLARDIELDKAILKRLRTHTGSRTELAKELGISYSALVSRITRLRRDGHEIPDGRCNTRRTARPIAA